MSEKERTKKIDFRVTKEEKELIDNHIEKLGFENRSHFLRKVVFDTNIIQTDLEPMKRLAQEVNSVGVNINQIVRKANQENHIDESILVELLNKLKDIEKITTKYIDAVYK